MQAAKWPQGIHARRFSCFQHNTQGLFTETLVSKAISSVIVCLSVISIVVDSVNTVAFADGFSNFIKELFDESVDSETCEDDDD
jgi:hypothetical protein